MNRQTIRSGSAIFRAVLFILTGTALVQAYLVLNARRAPEVEDVLATLEGGVLPSVELDEIGPSGMAGSGLRLPDALGDGECRIVVFFSSTCQGCVQTAPSWSGVDSIVREGITLPVVWVAAMTSDTGAADFLSRYNLPQPGYVFHSKHDLFAWRVIRWPQTYVVGEGGAVKAGFGPLPEHVDDLPEVCRGA